MILFETERLVGRDFEPERDAEAALRIYSDPEVTRWIGGETFTDIPSMTARLASGVERWAARGFPFCLAACARRDTGELVGAGLLRRLPDPSGADTEDVEVGWHLARACWGHGYATEIGRALIARAFAHLDVDAVYAVVDPGNERSARVALRCGMSHSGLTDAYYGHRLEQFVVLRGDDNPVVGSPSD